MQIRNTTIHKLGYRFCKILLVNVPIHVTECFIAAPCDIQDTWTAFHQCSMLPHKSIRPCYFTSCQWLTHVHFAWKEMSSRYIFQPQSVVLNITHFSLISFCLACCTNKFFCTDRCVTFMPICIFITYASSFFKLFNSQQIMSLNGEIDTDNS